MSPLPDGAPITRRILLSDRSETTSTGSLEAAEAKGRAAIERDDAVSALVWFEEALRLARSTRDDEALVYGLFHAGWILRYGFGRIEEAMALLAEAKRIADVSASERLIWAGLINLADAALDARDWRTAASLAAEALQPRWMLDRPVGDTTFLLEIAAFAAAGGGAAEEARCLYETATEARRHQGWDPGRVRMILERTDRLMAPARLPAGVRPSFGQAEPPLAFESAVALAIALPKTLLHVTR
jgi:tetratricopeptide (TPR) repeat protein